MVAPARDIATRVIHRVEHDGAWAAPALDAELRRASPSRQDAALATQIVYGALRVLPDLDEAITRRAKRSVRVDDWTHAALIGATFQLLHLGRVPPHAVVNDTVNLVRNKRGKGLAGFVNAILRKIAADRPTNPEPPTAVAVPAWLQDALHRSIGESRTDLLLSVGEEPPSIDLRVRTGLNRQAVASSILAARPNATVTPTGLSPLGLRVSGAGDVRTLQSYEEGAFAVQEEGAQLIGLLLGAQLGERVLDVCAGRGGKTAQLVEAVGEAGTVFATDVHEHRLMQIRHALSRLHLNAGPLEVACVDWTVGHGPVRGQFDRVLVDAPCTGLGTLRRRPEILLRTGPSDAARMGDAQRKILQQASSMVRPGGTLLYAVCSPLREEGLDVVERANLRGFDPFEDVPFDLKSLRFGSSAPLCLGPWVRGAGPWADAYQVFVWVNVG